MNSKIRVEYDFGKKEPYLRLYLDNQQNEKVDLNDQMLMRFIELAEMYPVVLIPEANNKFILWVAKNHESGINRFIETMEKWARPFFYSVSESEENELHLGKLYTDFFNRCQQCIDAIYFETYGENELRPPRESKPLPIKKYNKYDGTIRHYFEMCLSDGERQNAFDNTPKSKWDNKADHFSSALIQAFDWGESPQGYEYWAEIKNRVSAVPETIKNN